MQGEVILRAKGGRALSTTHPPLSVAAPLRLAAALLVASALLPATAARAQAPAPLSPPIAGEPSVPVPPATPVKPGLLAAGGAFDNPNPDVVVTVRAGVEVSPSYFGSKDYSVGPDLAARIDFLRLPGGFTYGSSRTVGFRQGWGLQGSFRYIGGRDGDDELAGFDDVPWSAEVGLGVGYEQRNWRAFTDVRYGVVGHNSWVGELGADAISYPVEGLTLTAGPRLSFGTDSFARTYFGVSNEESAANGELPVYTAHGGLLGAGVEVGARYLFNERWGVEGAANWQRLVNSAADSPITEQGDDDQYSVRIGITRRISLDF
jgi:outer membrane scaffolding protein for murein synthesis (MipA/OmpV family)